MKNLAQTFLTEAEQQRIKDAVAEVEKTTSGEIAPMIVSGSYTYPRADLAGGFIFGAIVGVAAALALGATDMWSFMGLFAVFAIAGYFAVNRLAGLKRAFIPASEMDDEVEEAAFVSFYQQGLHHTRDETGILIFISVFERKAMIMADRGINEKVEPGAWDAIVNNLTAGIKEGRAGEAICEAVRACGDIVSEKFPVKPDDADELKNLIIEE